jgi:phosphatidylglycerol:prolipoprotein diacylglycerol transferase
VIPYIHVPDLKPLGLIPLHPFGLLVATGVLLGTWITVWRARKIGYDVDLLNSFITWMLVAGFIGGHVFDEIFYHPDQIWKQPWSMWERGPQTLLWLWAGLSSFGGFLGALIGIVLWKFFEWSPDHKPEGKHVFASLYRRKTPLPLLPFADIVLSVFPVAWVFGRGGCAVVHDHPGRELMPGEPSWFAVEWPTNAQLPRATDPFQFVHGATLRYDLGLLEWMFTVVVATLLVVTWHKKLRTGTYITAIALVYAPVRFVMDYLRIPDSPGGAGDLRYGTLTFAQWMCIALFAFGLVLVWLLREHRARGYDPAALIMAPPETDEGEEPAPKKRRST